MNSVKIILLATMALLIIAGSSFWYFYDRTQAELRPPEITAEKLPFLLPHRNEPKPGADFLKRQEKVRFYHAEILLNPRKTVNYIELATLLFQEGRISGEHHYYLPLAEELLTKTLAIEENNSSAMALKAAIFMSKHQFRKAKELIDRAMTLNPHSAFAQGVLIDAFIELGKYERAVSACDRLLSIRPDLRSYARAAYLREIHGDLPGAIEAMRLAADAAARGGEERAWALYQLGKLYYQQGALDTAAFIYQGILEERPGYAHALSGMADIALAKQDGVRALDYLMKAIGKHPDHTFAEKLIRLLRTLDGQQNTESMIEQVLTDYREHEGEGWNINLEFARFCTENDILFEEALHRIEEEYRQRPDNIEVQDAYAWLLYKKGKAQQAIPLIESAMRLQTLSPAHVFHAGMIYHASDQPMLALRYLQPLLKKPYLLHQSDTKQAQEAVDSIGKLALIPEK